jgi:GNAT superfamily N-acetyltransferase
MFAPPSGPEQTFVLFDQDRPVGTASLAHDDLAARRDLTPWLAGVLVEPAFRGRGYATALVRRVEAFALSPRCEPYGLTPGRRNHFTLGLAGNGWGWRQTGGQEVVLMVRFLAD